MLAPGWVLTDVVKAYIAQSPEFAASVEPYAQTPAEVARIAIDGMLDQQYLIITNSKTVPFATEHAEAVLTELRRAGQPVRRLETT
jgi:hypothetical protein